MLQDRWTAEEYRAYLETGKEPTCKQALADGFRDPERQNVIEKAYAKAEAEGRVMVLDIECSPAKRPKYGNRKEREDGITFDSTHEHNVYRWLKSRIGRGELRWVFVHVPFRFRSGVVYWADFLTILADGTVEAVWDAKSDITSKNKDYVIKKKLLLEEWGIHIREVMRDHADGRGGYFSKEWE